MSGIPRARVANCLICNKEFRAVKDFSTEKGSRHQKYCSKDCWSKRATVYTDCEYCGKQVKSYKSWTKKFCNMECRNKGYSNRRGEKTSSWKGSKAGYSAIHKYLTATYGKPKVCEQCGSTKPIDWANKTGKYLRDRTDWLQLCRSCHFYYDGLDKTFRRYK